LGENVNNLLFLLSQETEKAERMRTELVEKNKMVAIGHIAAGVAHEVGNPLSSISSVVQMLKRSGTNSHMAEQLDLIEVHIQRISNTVRRVGSLARPVPEHWERVDITRALEEIIRLVRALEEIIRLVSFDHRAQNIDIHFHRGATPACTYALRGQLEQVFINLVLNALDAMPDGGELNIHAEQDDGHIRVRVRDTGSGIPVDTGRRVFDSFFTTKPPGQGTGLGLSVSHNIVQDHGGAIDYTSAAGKGTEFVVQIPSLDKPPEQ
jgi:signal transduction histidine kinase